MSEKTSDLAVAGSGRVQAQEIVENLRDTLTCCQNWADPEHDDDANVFPALQVSRAIALADEFLSNQSDCTPLRDHFAAQALAGMLAYYNGPSGDFHTNSTPDANAKYAYEQADAMLKARSA